MSYERRLAGIAGLGTGNGSRRAVDRGWYEHDRERWGRELTIARRLMTHVRGNVIDGIADIEGTVSVTSEHGHEYGPFDVTIRYPREFTRPGHVPDVYLRSHRQQWRAGRDSHIEEDWRLCLFVSIEAQIDFSDSGSLAELIAVARVFLFKEYVYQKALFRHLHLGGPPAVWPGQDRPHGLTGIREAIEAVGMPRRNAACPCGSGNQFKRCHGPRLWGGRGA